MAPGSSRNRRASAPVNAVDNFAEVADRERNVNFTAVLKAIEFECRLKREWMKQQQLQQKQQKSAENRENGGAGTSGKDADSKANVDEPPRFFEHFVVCGLPPDADVVAGTTSNRDAQRARQGECS